MCETHRHSGSTVVAHIPKRREVTPPIVRLVVESFFPLPTTSPELIESKLPERPKVPPRTEREPPAKVIPHADPKKDPIRAILSEASRSELSYGAGSDIIRRLYKATWGYEPPEQRMREPARSRVIREAMQKVRQILGGEVEQMELPPFLKKGLR